MSRLKGLSRLASIDQVGTREKASSLRPPCSNVNNRVLLLQLCQDGAKVPCCHLKNISTATGRLVDEFETAVLAEANSVLTVSIVDGQFTTSESNGSPVKFQGDYQTDLESISKLLKSSPCYVLYRSELVASGPHPQQKHGWTLVNYVPTTAEHAEKTLYLSSRESLKKSLGEKHFVNEMHLSKLADFTLEKYQAQKNECSNFKLFLGNLSFKTTADGVRNFFSQFGTVIDANIICRGTMPIGYGFVEYSCQEEVDRALELAQQVPKPELDGRSINIEVSRSTNTDRTGKKRDRRAKNAPRKGAERRRRTEEDSEEESDEDSDQEPSSPVTSEHIQFSSSSARRAHASRLQKQRKNQLNAAIGIAADDTPRRSSRSRKPKKSKKIQRPTEETSDEEVKINSIPTFIGNLPQTATEDDLSKLFEGFDIVSAKVVRRPNGHSKGYGFVKFADEETQNNALLERQDI